MPRVPSSIDIDAQNFGQQRRGILAVVERITALAAVAEADIKIAVRAEDDLAALMIEKGCGTSSRMRSEERSARWHWSRKLSSR